MGHWEPSLDKAHRASTVNCSRLSKPQLCKGLQAGELWGGVDGSLLFKGSLVAYWRVARAPAGLEEVADHPTNEVVWAEMPIESLTEIADYLMESGGEPIGGAILKDGKLIVEGVDANTKTFWIITSDYLLNGGDHMDFFQKRIKTEHTNLLLRDLMIDEVKRQGTLLWNNENRIFL